MGSGEGYVLNDPRWARWFGSEPPLTADPDALRLGLAREVVFPWHTLREVRIESGLLGHRVVVVPHDMPACLASIGLRPDAGPGRMWARRGHISTGVGNRRIDADAIVSALAALAGHRCRVGRG